MRALHLVGSAVSDFHAELSVLYARDCLAATADPARHEPHVAYVAPDGRWRFPDGLEPEAVAAAPAMAHAAALDHIAQLRPDVMVPQMFCLPGLTHYRALFDVLAIPYVGNPPDVMAVAAHKARAKAIVAAAGVRVAPGEVLAPGDTPTIDPPAVVKPVDADNSLGVSFVATAAEYDAAVVEAFAHTGEVLVEAFVAPGREVRCAVLEREGGLVCLPLEEYTVDATRRPIRAAADKLGRDADGALRLVAKQSPDAWIVDRTDPIVEPVWEAARRCHVALGCRDYSLFDFRVDPAGRTWFLEASLYCSFARQSVICAMAAAAGISVAELFDEGVAAALGRRGTAAP